MQDYHCGIGGLEDLLQMMIIAKRHVLTHEREMDRNTMYRYTSDIVDAYALVGSKANNLISVVSQVLGKEACHALYASQIRIIVFRYV